MVVVVKIKMTIVMTMNNKMGRIVNAGETTQQIARRVIPSGTRQTEMMLRISWCCYC